MKDYGEELRQSRNRLEEANRVAAECYWSQVGLIKEAYLNGYDRGAISRAIGRDSGIALQGVKKPGKPTREILDAAIGESVADVVNHPANMPQVKRWHGWSNGNPNSKRGRERRNTLNT